MANKEALDRVRARLAREEQEEASRLQDHAGIQEIKAAGDKLREEKHREELDREAAREQARREGRDAEMERLKSEFRNSYLGSTEEFGKAWPNLREQELSRLALKRVEKARQQSESYYQESF